MRLLQSKTANRKSLQPLIAPQRAADRAPGALSSLDEHPSPIPRPWSIRGPSPSQGEGEDWLRLVSSGGGAALYPRLCSRTPSGSGCGTRRGRAGSNGVRPGHGAVALRHPHPSPLPKRERGRNAGPSPQPFRLLPWSPLPSQGEGGNAGRSHRPSPRPSPRKGEGEGSRIVDLKLLATVVRPPGDGRMHPRHCGPGVILSSTYSRTDSGTR